MKDFSDKLIEILNHGALNLALSIGYKNRIFDVLEDLDSPVKLVELADATALDKRYLKEWLGIMVSGGIIELNAGSDSDDTFYLPPEHAAFLTRKSGSSNLGVYTQEIPLLTTCALASVEKGFKTGEGVSFDIYPDFQAFMAQLSDAKHEQVLIKEFLPSVDNHRLVERMNQGISVCDLGCGQGVAINLMAQAFPNSRFTGIDNHGAAIRDAEAAAQKMELSNVVFRLMDAAKIHTDKTFEGVFEYICTFDAIHDQSHPEEALKSVRHMLAPDGMFSMVDIKAGSHLAENKDHPMGPFLYTVSLMHCMPVGLTDNGTGLGMMWGRGKAVEMLKEAGFENIDVLEIPNDAFNLHFFCKK